MLFKHNCEKHGHKFEPRYRERANPIFSNLNVIESVLTEDLRELVVLKIYICDVCKYCGKVVNRE